MEWETGAPGKAYTKWAAQMAVGLNTGVPWIMCKQEDTPDPLVSYSSFFLTKMLILFCFIYCGGVYLQQCYAYLS